MDTREADILDRNKSLLLGNIIHSEDFYYHLKKENVLPETMIRDIQSGETQECKNGKLLHTLKLRGGDSYRRFRHVLYLSGHLFLADQLYGEDYEPRVLRGDEVFGKFPSIFKHVSDDVKTKFLRYMETRLKETSLRSAWLKSGTDRNDFLDVKKVNFEIDKEYRAKLEAKRKRISLLQDEIVHLKENIKKAESDRLVVQKEIYDMKMDFREELAKQSRFNAANNNSVIQLRSRFDNFNDRVKLLNGLLRGFLSGKENAEVTEEPDDVKMSSLEWNVTRLVQTAKSNMDHSSNSLNEKEVVLNMLKTSSRNSQETLSEVVRQYVDKQEKGKASLSRELEGLLDSVRGSRFTAKMSARPRTDMKLIKTQVATLKEEIDHMKKKVEWKNVQINDLIQETRVLREQLEAHTQGKDTERPLPTKQHPPTERESPDSIKEIENVYQQFDKYMTDAYIPEVEKPRMRRRGSLAEVNLEREISPPACRRDSKIENIDVVDVLSNARRPNFVEVESKGRRQSLPSISETNSCIGQSRPNQPFLPPERRDATPLDSARLEHIKNAEPKQAPDDVTEIVGASRERNPEIRRSRRKRKEVDIPDFKTQGRRPSLAELVTIYEDSHRKYELESEEGFVHY